jgi:UDP-N-acetylmuramoyl-L-alanyl-D-glutamate--2,6-diaminopimelate ligase
MKRPLMGAACARLADETVVTSDNPRSEDPEAIIDAIVSGMAGRVTHRDADRKAAILWTLAHAKAGDVVIVAGKGHETTQEIAGVKYPFDDRLVVAQA